MILFDANALSEILRPQPEAAVLLWLDSQNSDSLFISSITVAEQLYGIGALPAGRRKDRLAAAVERTITPFKDRLPVQSCILVGLVNSALRAFATV